jgi:hypothetical protein
VQDVSLRDAGMDPSQMLQHIPDPMLQLFQIPLIALGRIPAIKRNKLLGNIVFWVGLYAGFPLLCVAYCAY